MARLSCSTCQKIYDIRQPVWRCSCGGLLDIFDVPKFDLSHIDAEAQGLWRYRSVLPLEHDANIVSIGETMTPMTEVEINGHALYFKLDYLFPTGSFKDRGAAVLMSKVKELGITRVVEDSSGNAGAAIAAYGAAARIACDIYVPAETPTSKLAQIEAVRATLKRISGGRETTANAALKAATKTDYASHSWNPFFLHGVKTIAYEICEQLNWRSPNVFITPVGNGTLLLGAYLGFRELFTARLIKRLPKIIAVQAEHCAPLATAFNLRRSNPEQIEKKPTIAEGIAVAEPIRGEQILAAVRDSGGDFIKVSEKEIANALLSMHKRGIYIEPTAAVSAAGAAQICEHLSKNELVVSVFTGHGLKSKNHRGA